MRSLIADRQPDQIWEVIRSELQLAVSPSNFQTWLKETRGVHLTPDELVVTAPNTFAAEWLMRRIRGRARDVLQRLTGQASIDIHFAIAGAGGERAAVAAEGAPAGEEAARGAGSSFNPSYTFERFALGPENRTAHDAALAVSTNPGHVYNPLLLHGDVGLGKTHLLHAAGHVLAAAGLEPVYVGAEEFVHDFVAAARRDPGRPDPFRRKYWRASALLLDDVQLVGGKERTQAAFVALFNTLHDAGHQIVLAADEPPHAIPLLHERLRSRFAGGLTVPLHAPGLQTRLEIVRAAAAEHGVSLDDATADFLATLEPRDIRRLRGSLTRTLAFARLTGRPVDAALAAEALRDHVPASGAPPLSPQAILSATARFYSLEPSLLVQRSRDRRTTLARHVAVYLLRELTGCSYKEIGQLLGGRDHSTLHKAVQRIAAQAEHDVPLRAALDELRTTVGTPA